MDFNPVKGSAASSSINAPAQVRFQCRMEDNDFRHTVCMHKACHYCTNILAAKASQNSTSSDLMASFRTAMLRYILLKKRRIKKSMLRTIATCVVVFLCVVYLELSCAMFEKYFFETNFNVGFKYPADLEDFPQVVKRFINHSGDFADFEPKPINPAYSGLAFLRRADSVADVENGLLIIVKSATGNVSKRKAIRITWGDVHYLQQITLVPNLPTKVVFICGVPNEREEQHRLLREEQSFGDIVVAQFEDTYENNTFKTMLALRWAVEEVKSFKYLMIVDDDMYVNPANVIEFVDGIPSMEIVNIISPDSGVPAFYTADDELVESVPSEQRTPFGNKPLIMGQLIIDAKPFRNAVGLGSKWSMSFREYPYNYFPPYVAGGAILFDVSAVTDLYYASYFTKHCWIDDVYVGILAYKLGITLTNSNLMNSSYRGNLGKRLRDRFGKMIAVHGLECPEQLVELWSTVDIDALTDCKYHFSNSTLR